MDGPGSAAHCVTRFAPSPTGPLHLGHAYSVLVAADLARQAGGRFILRIEDLDQTRARAEWRAAIFADLRWLGLSWPEPVMRQSERGDAYRAAIADLWHRGLVYPCSCTRRDILAALSAPQEGAAIGPDGPVYLGTCRPAAGALPPVAPPPRDVALRLDLRRALAACGLGPADMLHFDETGPFRSRIATGISGRAMVEGIGDVVLARRAMDAAYHLAVVVDDADQAVTLVVRGEDLAPATPIHRLLQVLLKLPVPRYHHHRLIRDEAGKRLAKRDDARALAVYRAAGATPGDIRAMVGFTPSAP